MKEFKIAKKWQLSRKRRRSLLFLLSQSWFKAISYTFASFHLERVFLLFFPHRYWNRRHPGIRSLFIIHTCYCFRISVSAFPEKLESIMAVKGCLACIKYMVLLINFVFWLAGVALLSLSIWMYVDTAAYLVSDHNDKFFVSIYILMAAGSLMTLVGFLGCCGAMQESSCMLGTFSTFVILIFAAEIAGAVYGYSHKDEVKTALTKTVTNMVKNEYSVQDAVTLAVDAMQQKLACCGATGISDWENSSFNNKNKESGILSVLSISYKVPPSCCKTDDSVGCEAATNIVAANTFTNSLYSEGCLSKITEKIEKHLFTIIVAGISIAVIQIFGFVFSLVLCCAISGRDY